jgi:phosphatidylglycerophosphate synthase
MSLKKHTSLSSLQSRLGRHLAFIPFSPNQITLSALLFAIIGLFFAHQGSPFPSLLFFILAGAADAIDGAVARARGQVSAKGAYIDGIVDRLVEFLFVLSLFFYPLPAFILPAWLLLLFLLFFGSAMTSFATAYANHRKVASYAKISCQPGVLPRAERLLLLYAALFFVPIFPASASFILLCAAALSLLTFAQRFLYFAK